MERSDVTTWTHQDMQQPRVTALASGQVAWFTTRCRTKSTPNEDALALLALDDQRGAIVLADGFGGQPAGDRASRLAVDAVCFEIDAALRSGNNLQAAIIAGFDQANHAVRALGVGAATTLAVLEIAGPSIRPYHVGDSEVLAVGQRGRIRLQTIAHSPVGYRVEAGVLDQEQAMHDEDRHVVSNMVGSEEMRIDVGPILELRPFDTVVIGSDGLFDNLTVTEIVEIVRIGDLLRSTEQLVATCHQRMTGDTAGPSKPDDLSVAVFRLTRRSSP